MLLANMSVARQIYNHAPKLAVLRRHPPPQTRQLDELETLCRGLGIDIDTSSAMALQQSIAALSDGSEDAMTRTFVLTSMCSKPMQVMRTGICLLLFKSLP